MQCIYFIDLIRMDLIESLKRFKLMEITMMILYIYIFVRSDIDKLLLPIGCLRPFYSIPFDGGVVVVVLSWQKTKKKKNVYELMLMMTPHN